MSNIDRASERPLVSFVLLAYNQEKYIREAVEAALNQEYARLEIIVSDDCSTDSTFEIINSVVSNYSGSYKIVVNRNPVNLGLAKHFSKLIAMAEGEIIVAAAGDDISLPARVSKSVEMLCSDPEASIVSFTDMTIDERGTEIWRPWQKNGVNIVQKVMLEEYISGVASHLSGASRGFRKRIFEVFGHLNDACPTEDTPYILRGLMLGHALVSSESGILYRRHDKNLSGPRSLHSMKIEEIRKQYLCDVEFALSSGLISESLMQQISNWIEKNFRRRELSRDLYMGSSKLKFFLQKVITSKDFNLREKIGMLRRTFRP